MDKAGVAAVHRLQLETPIELAGLGDEGTLEVKHELIEQRLVRAIVEKSAEVLIILRVVRIEGDTAFDPAGNGQTRFRFFLLDELGLGRFFFRSQGLRGYFPDPDSEKKEGNDEHCAYAL